MAVGAILTALDTIAVIVDQRKKTVYITDIENNETEIYELKK